MSGRPPGLLAQPSRPCPLPRTHGPYCQPLRWPGARLCPLPRHAPRVVPPSHSISCMYVCMHACVVCIHTRARTHTHTHTNGGGGECTAQTRHTDRDLCMTGSKDASGNRAAALTDSDFLASMPTLCSLPSSPCVPTALVFAPGEHACGLASWHLRSSRIMRERLRSIVLSNSVLI